MELIKFIIGGSLSGLNEYTKANRSNKYGGAKLKADNEVICTNYIKWQVTSKLEGKYSLNIDWYEKDERRDFDNVVFAEKFILDSLVKCGVVKNDSRKYFTEMNHRIFVDKVNPRIEVTLIGV